LWRNRRTCSPGSPVRCIRAIAHGAGSWIAEQLVIEVAAIDAARGSPQEDEALDAGRTVTEPGSAQVPSLLQDLRSGNHTEAGHLGDLIARRSDPSSGLVNAALVGLRVHESARSAG
jgi:hypothetical protein